jgi:thiamine biosynthesis lipoprotein
MMGGIVGVHLTPGADPAAGSAGDGRARADAERILRRIEVWASRLTRFTPTSDLSHLNAARSPRVPVRPTLAAVLDWGRQAQGMSDGIVDIALLDARLAAEGIPSPTSTAPRSSAASRRWSLDRGARRSDVLRPAGLTFDLDGVAKGWLADRALRRSRGYASTVIDADGDIAIGLGAGSRVRFAVADPWIDDGSLAVLELRGPDAGVDRCFGLATSGRSVHRWSLEGRPSHHLIDPRSGLPAVTDVVQATVLAGSAREAEAIAKTAVILGSEAAFALLDRPAVLGAILLTERGDLLATPSTRAWLA